MLLDFRNPKDSVLISRGGLVYVQNLGTGKVRMINKDDVVRVCGTVTSSHRVIGDKEKEKLVDLQVKWEVAHKKTIGDNAAKFKNTARGVMQRFFQTPEEFLESFDKKFAATENDNDRSRMAEARTELEYGIAVNEGRGEQAEHAVQLMAVAAAWKTARAEAVKKIKEDEEARLARKNAEALAMQMNAARGQRPPKDE